MEMMGRKMKEWRKMRRDGDATEEMKRAFGPLDSSKEWNPRERQYGNLSTSSVVLVQMN